MQVIGILWKILKIHNGQEGTEVFSCSHQDLHLISDVLTVITDHVGNPDGKIRNSTIKDPRDFEIIMFKWGDGVQGLKLKSIY